MRCITPTVQGVPNASGWGTKSEVAHKRADGLRNLCQLGILQHFRAEEKISRCPKVGGLGYDLCHVGYPQHVGAEDKISNGPQVGALAK